jgi:hypothetical protein
MYSSSKGAQQSEEGRMETGTPRPHGMDNNGTRKKKKLMVEN